MRVVVVPTPEGHKLLEVAEPLRARQANWYQSNLMLLAIPLGLSLVFLIAFGTFLAGRATRSLVDAAGQVTQRTPADLRSLHVGNAPDELVPILEAINALFARIENSLNNERRFTSSAAHELRSPLAAIKLQAQVAMLTTTDVDRNQALRYLMTAIDSASHMIDQLLTMSRVDGLIALKKQASLLQLDSVASHLIDEMRPLLARRGQGLEDRLDAADIEGHEFGVAVLLRNLIDNASRYSQDGKIIRVTTGTHDDGCPFLCVDDQGPGIPPEERQRVFERFTRLTNETGADGCGIGLSIVRAVVDLHHARVSLDASDLGGLRVCVAFPPAAGAA
jgi:signal transduction histidine kinase